MPYESKKRKRDDPSKTVDTSRPSSIFRPRTPRPWTLSIALPGSIIANAQSHDLKTLLAGSIARALAVFCVDEVIIFDDGHTRQSAQPTAPEFHRSPSDMTYTGDADPSHFLVHILSYLETPPHLRKQLFPIHPNLRTAGTLPSLDMPHHLRANEWCVYREGVTVDEQAVNGTERGLVGKTKSPKDKSKRGRREEAPAGSTGTTIVDAGLRKQVKIDVSLPPKTRVTLKFSGDDPSTTQGETTPAEAVSPDLPREEAGYYWGYAVRRAASLSAVFTECPFDGGYDVSFGTSERGMPLGDVLAKHSEPWSFRHMIIVFGGVAGLEIAVKGDEELVKLGLEQPSGLFDYWVNLCPGQGSRTIRTEEAIWIGLMGLKSVVDSNVLAQNGDI